MREIKEIIIHCSATYADQQVTIDDIRSWHRALGWHEIGYHYVITQSGQVQEGRSIENAGAHCKGHNANSIGICYIGGISNDGHMTDTRTDAQREALLTLVKDLLQQFPDATVHGHNEFANKACPCFSVQEWLKEVDL